MKPLPRSVQALWLIAISAFLIGTVSTIISLMQMKSKMSTWHRKSRDIYQLSALRTERNRLQAAMRMHEQWRGPMTPVQNMAGTFFPGVSHVNWKESSDLLAPGWRINRLTLSLADVPADTVFRFLTAVASNNPPWNLESGNLQSGSASGRLARIELTLSRVQSPGVGNAE